MSGLVRGLRECPPAALSYFCWGGGGATMDFLGKDPSYFTSFLLAPENGNRPKKRPPFFRRFLSQQKAARAPFATAKGVSYPPVVVPCPLITSGQASSLGAQTQVSKRARVLAQHRDYFLRGFALAHCPFGETAAGKKQNCSCGIPAPGACNSAVSKACAYFFNPSCSSRLAF